MFKRMLSTTGSSIDRGGVGNKSKQTLEQTLCQDEVSQKAYLVAPEPILVDCHSE